MKNIIYTVFISLALLSCNDDSDLITVSSVTDNELIATTDQVVLTTDNSSKLVLSLAWDTNELLISDPDMSPPSVEAFLEVSSNSTFEEDVVTIDVTNNSVAFTGAEMNSISSDINLIVDEVNLVYFRVGAASGSNIEPTYSNVVTVDITPYYIDMSKASVLNANSEETGQWLASNNEDGIYSGFMAATSWMNFYIQEGNGTLWGNESENYTAFLASSKSPANFWFPEPAGSYYVELDTEKEEWQATNLTKVTVDGDFTGEMTFDRANNIWSLPIDVNAQSYSVTLSANTNIYNITTGTDTYNESTMAFAQEGEGLTISETPESINVMSNVSGSYALLLDLSDPANIKLTIGEQVEEPEEIPSQLYLYGIDDGISGTWNYDNFLTLEDEENEQYIGIASVNSSWGYQLTTANVDGEGLAYKHVSGDANSGTIGVDGSDNIPAPDAGVYFFDVSTSEHTYNLSLLEDKVYLSGVNNVWDFDKSLQKMSEGVYSGSITFTEETQWGFNVYLFADNWDVMFGGNGGQIYFNGDGFTEDSSLGVGTYTMTIDFINGTYSIE